MIVKKKIDSIYKKIAIFTVALAVTFSNLGIIAFADVTTNFNGELTNENTFNRPMFTSDQNGTYTAQLTAADVVGVMPDNFAYFTRNIIPSVTGNYTIAVDGNNTHLTDLQNDTFMIIYKDSFNPSSPTQNVLYANDDINNSYASQVINVPLEAGRTYVMVVSSYSPSVTGPVAFTVTGAGSVTVEANQYSSDVPAVTTYSLNYSAGNHGSISGAITQTVNSGDNGQTVTAVPDPGYHFVKWSDDNTSATRTDLNVSGNINVIAQFAINVYTVTFKNFDGSNLTTSNISYGNPITVPTAPTRTGYTFGGWYKDNEFINPWNFETDMVKADTTLYSKWIINSYTVTFKNYDGTTIDTQSVNYGGSADAPSSPTRQGYNFAGWDINFTNVTQNLIVTATYTAIPPTPTYTVEYKNYDGSTINTDVVEGGSGLTEPTVPTRTGYTFGGWYKDNEFITPWNFESDKIAGNTVLYSKWSINKYTVTFKDHDETIISTQTVNYGGSAVAPLSPSREGYTFTGWDMSFSNVTGNLIVTATYTVIPPKPIYIVSYKNYDGSVLNTESVVSGNKITEPTAPTTVGYTFGGWYKDSSFESSWKFDTDTVTGDTTLYSKWTINSYTVTFKNYDGTTIKTQSVNYGSSAVAPTSPNRAGYTFTGWDKTFNNIIENIIVTATYKLDEGKVIPLEPKTTDGSSTEATTPITFVENEKNTITLDTQNSKISVPADAIDLTGLNPDYLKVLEKVVSNTEQANLIKVMPTGLSIVGKILDFRIQLFDSNNLLLRDIHNFKDNKTVRISIKVSKDMLQGLDTNNMSMYYYDETNQKWVELGGNYDESTGLFSFDTPHFTKFAIMASKVNSTSGTIPKTGSVVDTNLLIGIGILLLALGSRVFITGRKKIKKS
ncbi:InlB B-repeat-containing protein [Clostridium sp. YIM B02551]|uniref:InlB B-repeat-containing protein n=1 Tax=Clostridium sp. YIM B02551 TaxID=2910679 RepID=UPI001EEBD315|nr:InlB B-repeat-containing protein [Clostridium sp. YIM B02551]